MKEEMLYSQEIIAKAITHHFRKVKEFFLHDLLFVDEDGAGFYFGYFETEFELDEFMEDDDNASLFILIQKITNYEVNEVGGFHAQITLMNDEIIKVFQNDLTFILREKAKEDFGSI